MLFYGNLRLSQLGITARSLKKKTDLAGCDEGMQCSGSSIIYTDPDPAPDPSTYKQVINNKKLSFYSIVSDLLATEVVGSGSGSVR